jgi:hypothetical protein
MAEVHGSKTATCASGTYTYIWSLSEDGTYTTTVERLNAYIFNKQSTVDQSHGELVCEHTVMLVRDQCM